MTTAPCTPLSASALGARLESNKAREIEAAREQLFGLLWIPAPTAGDIAEMGRLAEAAGIPLGQVEQYIATIGSYRRRVAKAAQYEAARAASKAASAARDEAEAAYKAAEAALSRAKTAALCASNTQTECHLARGDAQRIRAGMPDLFAARERSLDDDLADAVAALEAEQAEAEQASTEAAAGA